MKTNPNHLHSRTNEFWKDRFIAETFDEISADLISVDSVQIYKHADIGSNKISRNFKKYPHELIDIIEPNEVYSVGEFLKDLKRTIDKSVQSNKVPVLVGGSMMYFFHILLDLMIFLSLIPIPEERFFKTL